MSPPFPLRAVLAVDAATCLATGTLLAAAAGPIAGLTGLPAGLCLWSGLSLLPIGVAIALVAARPIPMLVALVIAGNLGWLLGSLLLVMGGGAGHALGVAFVLAQAAVAAVLTWFEWLGLRQAGRLATT